MIHEFNISVKQHSWVRPTYKRGNQVSKETFMSSTTTAFRTRITDEFNLTIINNNCRERFPLIDELAVHIDVHSANRYILPFVVKNVLDALKGHAYSDDGLICSICAEQYSGCDIEGISVALYVNKHFREFKDIQGQKPFISFATNVVPSDIILPLRASPEHTIEQSTDNLLIISAIEKDVLANYNGRMYQSVAEVSIDINSTLNKADIDNVAFPFLMAMNGIVYEDMLCIDKLLLNINKRCNSDMAVIRLVSGGDV